MLQPAKAGASADNGEFTYEKYNRDRADRMSLSSTMSSNMLDVADLSTVWNRKENIDQVDERIHNQVAQKYKMDKWLRFQDAEAEHDFVEKYFYGSVMIVRVICLVATSIHLGFFVIEISQFTQWSLETVRFSMAGLTAVSFVITFHKRFRDIHLYLLTTVLWVELFGLVLVRYYYVITLPDEGLIWVPDARGVFIEFIFGIYATYTTLRFPLRMAIFNGCALQVIYNIGMALTYDMTVGDYIENNIFYLGISALVLPVCYASEKRQRVQEAQRAEILMHTEEVVKEKMITEKLLLNILPRKIAKRLIDGEATISDGYTHVTVLFADLVDWTYISSTMSPSDAIALLNDIVSTFDRIAASFKVEKIKTIGDGYLAACGLPDEMAAERSSEIMADFAIEMLRAVDAIATMKQKKLQIAIGMHTGPIVAGVIGKSKFLYDLWGDSVNLASRMQSHGAPGRIHTTEQVYELLGDAFDFEKRPVMYVKGKGDMQTYFLDKRTNNNDGETNVPTKFGMMMHNNEDQGLERQEVSTEPTDAASSIQEAKTSNDSKPNRKKRKTREAVSKKALELEKTISTIISMKYGLLKFLDADLENQFNKMIMEQLHENFTRIVCLLMFLELFVGIHLVQFKTELMESYYIGVSLCILIQCVTIFLNKWKPAFAVHLMTANINVIHLCYIVLFGYYRMTDPIGTRFIFHALLTIQVFSCMTSQLSYRHSLLVIQPICLAFLVLQLALKPEYSFDMFSCMLYTSLLFFALVTVFQIERTVRKEFLLSHFAKDERLRVMKQREESERLLYNILPESIVSKMRESNGKLIETYDDASILFADIVGFTVLSSKLSANKIVEMLNDLFTKFDNIATRKGLEKIKTIGDAYMVVGGIPYPNPEHVQNMVDMGLEMIDVINSLPEIEGLRVNLRLGVHCGPVVGGMVGLSKMVFDVWGKSVNIASKMESNGKPGHLNISKYCKERLKDDDYTFTSRSEQLQYGDQLVEMFFVEPLVKHPQTVLPNEW